jgi:hypothetical protein
VTSDLEELFTPHSVHIIPLWTLVLPHTARRRGLPRTLTLEQRRKRLIQHAQELTFLNHHIWNAITQMTMASYFTDADEQQRIRCEAVERISGALRRVANSADLNGISLEVDLTGVELTREAEKRTA